MKKYREMVEDYVSQEGQLDHVMEEILFNIGRILDLDFEKFSRQSKILTETTFNRLETSGQKECLGVDLGKLKEQIVRENDFTEWKKFRRPTGWRAGIYKSIKRYIINPRSIRLGKKYAFNKTLGLLLGMLDELQSLGVFDYDALASHRKRKLGCLRSLACGRPRL